MKNKPFLSRGLRNLILLILVANLFASAYWNFIEKPKLQGQIREFERMNDLDVERALKLAKLGDSLYKMNQITIKVNIGLIDKTLTNEEATKLGNEYSQESKTYENYSNDLKKIEADRSAYIDGLKYLSIKK